MSDGRLRVLMVTGAYFPEISSGGRQVRLMSSEMRDAVVVRVITTALDLNTPRRSQVDAVDVVRIHLRSLGLVSKIAALAVMLREVPPLMRWCDVVHLHGVSSKNVLITALARLFGRPIVLSLHTMGADEPAIVKRSGPLSWWAFRAATRYLAVSPALRQSYVDSGLPADRIDEVGNGLDTRAFAPATHVEKRELRERLQLDAERPLILYVGFFSKDKQPKVLFDAWLSLRERGVDASLVFVGATESDYSEVDATLHRDIRAAADRRGVGDRVTFTGPRQNVHDYFRAADVFALPSRREGLPVALMEAMSCGLPCVASRLAGATDVLIDNGVSGVLVPPGDVEALAAGLLAVLTNPDLASRLGTAARESVSSRFSAATISKQWLNSYQRARSEIDRP